MVNVVGGCTRHPLIIAVKFRVAESVTAEAFVDRNPPLQRAFNVTVFSQADVRARSENSRLYGLHQFEHNVTSSIIVALVRLDD